MCDCHTVGGRFIGADPDCPVHGVHATQQADRVELLEALRAKMHNRREE